MIKRECVDEEQWVSQETFKATLAVYQVMPWSGGSRAVRLLRADPGWQARRLPCRARLHAARLPLDAGPLDPLRRGEPWRPPREVFYGLKAAVGALIARALVRLGRNFVTDAPLALIAVAGFALTLFAVRASPSSCSEPDWRTSSGWTLLLGGPDLRFRSAIPAVLIDRRRRHHALAHRRDLLGGPEGRPAHLRRCLHGRSLPPGGSREPPPLAYGSAVRRRPRAGRCPPRAADHLLDLRRLSGRAA